MSDLEARLTGIIEAVLDGMDLDGDVTIGPGEDGGLVISVAGEALEPMIGREGATINALQYLVQQVVFRATEGEVRRVTLDAGGYRDRRRRQLEALAAHAATEAVEHGEEIELDAMTPHDRRIVHMALAERTDIVTRSEGEEPNRRIVVLPADLADD
jgi:spoIIIJ-associated protein